jgi:hypothetical protein
MEEQSVGSRGSEVSAAGLFRIIGHQSPPATIGVTIMSRIEMSVFWRHGLAREQGGCISGA